MKKGFFFLFILFFAASLSAQKVNQDSLIDTYKKEFLLNAASFAVGGFEVGVGLVNSNNHNRRFFLGYYFLESPDFYDDGLTFPDNVERRNMEGVRAEFQYLVMKPTETKRRFYGGGYALFKTIGMDVKKETVLPNAIITQDYRATGTSLGFGIIGGIRVFMIENFFADLYLGGGVIFPLSESNIDDVHLDVLNPYKRSINPRGGITFGIAF